MLARHEMKALTLFASIGLVSFSLAACTSTSSAPPARCAGPSAHDPGCPMASATPAPHPGPGGGGMMNGGGMGGGPMAEGCAMMSSSTPSTPLAAFSAEVAMDVERALISERRAEATYAKVLDTFEDANPFVHIVHAETRHSWAIENLYRARGVEPPKTDLGTIPTYSTAKEACAGGVATEKANVAMYDELLEKTNLPSDVRAVFEHLRMVSSKHHLPAFEACD